MLERISFLLHVLSWSILKKLSIVQLYFLLPLVSVQYVSKQIDAVIVCFKWKMSIRRRPALPFPFIVEISSLCSSVHILAKLERPHYVIILGESCKALGEAQYDVESSTSRPKFERFPALTPAASTLVLCVCVSWFFFFFFFLNVSIFMVWNNVHCLGPGLFAQT